MDQPTTVQPTTVSYTYVTGTGHASRNMLDSLTYADSAATALATRPDGHTVNMMRTAFDRWYREDGLLLTNAADLMARKAYNRLYQ